MSVSEQIWFNLSERETQPQHRQQKANRTNMDLSELICSICFFLFVPFFFFSTTQFDNSSHPPLRFQNRWLEESHYQRQKSMDNRACSDWKYVIKLYLIRRLFGTVEQRSEHHKFNGRLHIQQHLTLIAGVIIRAEKSKMTVIGWKRPSKVACSETFKSLFLLWKSSSNQMFFE